MKWELNGTYCRCGLCNRFSLVLYLIDFISEIGEFV